MLEGYTTLGFLAASTRRVELGTLVTAVSYRSPGLLVKQVTTLDVLSGGRVWLGIGAGWYEREARGLGLPFPALAARFEQLEETLQIAQRMWRGDAAPIYGKHFMLAEPIGSPRPLNQPRPRILIGGGGERKTLRLVARYADACNLFGRLPAWQLRRKLAVLRSHCERFDRSYDEIEKTVLTDLNPLRQSSQQIVDQLGSFAELGFGTAIVSLRQVETLRPLELLGGQVFQAVERL
ncbi:MAG: TIGR03560 family F420-dependent LLM class oxidoreductase, partial [Chloroflexota bacterium]|nr:TIGR03560 family F420-dependent LLM class oxidoreductase [Chloroflexota bacterium]